MPRTKSGRVKINVYLEGDTYAALKKLALIQACPASELIRAACESFVQHNAEEIEMIRRRRDEMHAAIDGVVR